MGPQAALPPRVRRHGLRRKMRTSLDLRHPAVPAVYIEPAGMVELALTELGARLLWVQPEPTSDSQN
jgi:hypothetical protein